MATADYTTNITMFSGLQNHVQRIQGIDTSEWQDAGSKMDCDSSADAIKAAHVHSGLHQPPLVKTQHSKNQNNTRDNGRICSVLYSVFREDLSRGAVVCESLIKADFCVCDGKMTCDTLAFVHPS